VVTQIRLTHFRQLTVNRNHSRAPVCDQYDHIVFQSRAIRQHSAERTRHNGGTRRRPSNVPCSPVTAIR